MKLQVFVVVAALFLLQFAFTDGPPAVAEEIEVKEPVVEPMPVVSYDTLNLSFLTIYHPVKEQCDATPLITANHWKIDLNKLKRQEFRWMAVSQDLIKSKTLSYGDTLVISGANAEVDGKWVVADCMNARWRSRGDLLFHPDIRKTGYWKNVKILRKRVVNQDITI